MPELMCAVRRAHAAMTSTGKRRTAIGIAWGAASVLACTPVRAQVPGRSLADAAETDSVGARSKANYDAIGIPVGGFRLYASAAANLSYDDNVYNTQTQRRSDGIAVLAPRVEMRSQSPGHDLVLSADASIQRFNKLHAENNEQYNLAADGRLAIAGSADLAANAFYGRRSEMRGTLGDVVIGAPNQYDRLGGGASVAVELVNLVLRAGGSVESLDYKPVRIDGTTISQDYRDQTTYSGTFRAGLQVGPGLRLLTQADYNTQRYRRRFAAIGQNSHGYALLAGVDFGLTELISGEIKVGYLAQTYNLTSIRTIGGISYNGKLVWNPTTLLTVTLTGGRTLEPSPFLNQAGVMQDSANFQLDYELLRNLIVSISERGTFDRYRGLDRRDRLYTTDISARYLLSRTVETGLRFNHRQQSSNGTLARRYTGTSATISLIVKL